MARPLSLFLPPPLSLRHLVLGVVTLCLVTYFRTHPRAGAGAAGAGAEYIYASPLVRPAPAPGLAETGDSELVDTRGSYQRHAFGTNDGGAAGGGTPLPYVNVVYSRAGTLRSGDLHRCAQLNVLVTGAATLTRLVAGDELVTSHQGGLPPDSVVLIPPHVPHIWAFTADTVMTEAWLGDGGAQCAFQAWYYEPFRERVAAAMGGANATTATATGV
ncbi:hypothetical protein MMPV_001812 [Pyropia vietnamensis]